MQKPIENQTGILFVQAAADVTLWLSYHPLVAGVSLQRKARLEGRRVLYPFLIRPHEPYFSEDNSNTFKVRMCIPELKRAKSTIPLECIRDSSTLACLKKNTLAQLFLFCPSLMANAFSLNGFHNKRCGWRTGDGEIFSRLEGFAMLWAEDARNYWSGSGWRGMINSLDSIFGA